MGACRQTWDDMSQNSNPRRMRGWIPANLILLALASSACLRFLEVPFLEFIWVGIGLLTTLLLGFWYVFFTGLPQKKRWMLLLSGIGLLLGAYCVIYRFTRAE